MYRLTRNPMIIERLDDPMFIPVDPLNRDYRKYLAWAAKGNKADPAAPEPVLKPTPPDPEIEALKSRVAALEAK